MYKWPWSQQIDNNTMEMYLSCLINICVVYTNWWMNISQKLLDTLFSQDKIERQKIEDEMGKKKILYQNILHRSDTAQEMIKENLITIRKVNIVMILLISCARFICHSLKHLLF